MNLEREKKILAEGRFVRLVHQDGWEWAERTNSSGVVAVVAVDHERRIILTEQYRPPLNARVLDLPAGLSGDVPGAENEDLRQAARRELMEETGYEAGHLEFLVEGPGSAGLTNEVLTFFLARDVRRVGPGGGDEGEEIEVHVVPLDEVESRLDQWRADGVLVDPKIYAGIYFASRSLV